MSLNTSGRKSARGENHGQEQEGTIKAIHVPQINDSPHAHLWTRLRSSLCALVGLLKDIASAPVLYQILILVRLVLGVFLEGAPSCCDHRADPETERYFGHHDQSPEDVLRTEEKISRFLQF